MCDQIDSIRYINFYYDSAKQRAEKALGWLLMALNEKDLLKQVMIEVFSNPHVLQLYDPEQSYIWQNRK